VSAEGRELPAGTYGFDDLAVGDRWRTGAITVTDWHILTFAGLSGDFFDVHMDDGFAKAAGFEGRIAHGILGLALVDGLKNRAGVRLKAIASLGWTWDFRRPICPGDRISAVISVAGLRQTKRPDRGIATLAFDAVNGEGQTVQEGQNRLMMERGA
jgi:acyl dehydratase